MIIGAIAALDSLEGPKAQKVRVSRNDHVQASLQGALQHAVVVTVRGHRIKTFGRIYVPSDALDESVSVFELFRCAMKLVGLDLQRPLAPTVSLVPVDLCLP